MALNLPPAIRSRALESLKGASGVSELEIYYVETDELLDGSVVYRIEACAPGDPNGDRFEVVMDAQGKSVDREAFESETSTLLFAAQPPIRVFERMAAAAAPITVSPATNDLTLATGDTFQESITVTVPASSGVKKVDVYFLADATGSMFSAITGVQSGANTIISALSGLGLDIAFGVGHYRDLPTNNPPFSHQLAPTTPTTPVSTALITTEINNWNAFGGDDTPEAQLYALDQLAEAPGGTIGWRGAAKRIIVWFGDAPGHDPICKAISGLPYDIKEASATSKLASESISVLAIDVGDLDGDPTGGTDYTATCGAPGGALGQATRIAAATGGSYTSGVNGTTIASTIISLVGSAATTIGTLKLIANGATAPFVQSVSPAGGYGPLTLNSDQTKSFDVTFLGSVECTDKEQAFNGTLDVVADGVVVAQKTVKIAVPACGTQVPVPEKCPSLHAPADAIQQALDHPETVFGWMMLCNPGLPYNPVFNTYRTRLQLQNPSLAYDDQFNRLVYRCGCL